MVRGRSGEGEEGEVGGPVMRMKNSMIEVKGEKVDMERLGVGMEMVRGKSEGGEVEGRKRRKGKGVEMVRGLSEGEGAGVVMQMKNSMIEVKGEGEGGVEVVEMVRWKSEGGEKRKGKGKERAAEVMRMRNEMIETNME